METQEREALSRRIERLERDARRWRLASLSAAGGIAFLALTGATTPSPSFVPELRVGRLVLVDGSGDVAGTLAADVAGNGPELKLSGSRRPGVARLNGDGIFLYDREPSQKLGTLPPGVELQGPTNDPKLNEALYALYARRYKDSPERPRVVLTGTGWPLDNTRNPDPSLTLMDAGGNLRLVLGYTVLDNAAGAMVRPRSVSSIVLADEKGTVIFRVP